MPEYITRTTTFPGDRSSSCSGSKSATTPSSWLRMRNALNVVMCASATALAAPFVPRDQALCVEIQIVPQQMFDLPVALRTPMLSGKSQPQPEHVGADRLVAVFARTVTPGDRDELAYLRLERLGEPRHIANAAVVHQVHRLGRERQHTIDGGQELLGVELGRRRRRGDESSLRRVECSIGNSKRIAGKDARVGAIDDG